jgi:hypothetical protein
MDIVICGDCDDAGDMTVQFGEDHFPFLIGDSDIGIDVLQAAVGYLISAFGAAKSPGLPTSVFSTKRPQTFAFMDVACTIALACSLRSAMALALSTVIHRQWTQRSPAFCVRLLPAILAPWR